MQVEFVKRIANTLSEEHCRLHVDVFEMLKTHLGKAVTRIESVMKRGAPGPGRGPDAGIKRWKYLLVREAIDEAVQQLEQWQRIFDPTWFLILRIGDELIDSELSTTSTLVGSVSSSPTMRTAQKIRGVLTSESVEDVHVSLPEDGLDWKTAEMMKFSTISRVRRSGSDKMFIVDSVVCEFSLDVPRARADAELLAKKLRQVDPTTFGLLACHGLIKRKAKDAKQLTSIALVFRPPNGEAEPTCLRQLLLQPPTSSLSQVLNIARQLAKAVSFMHTCNFVHKNIRPETILVFPDDSAPTTLGAAYLLGFDSFRSLNFYTRRNGDAAWERNLYRHPLRQGLNAQEVYIMQHDVYSLGVCLLELGLRETFVNYEVDGNGGPDLKRVPSEALGLKLEDFDFRPGEGRQQSARIKDHLVDMAKTKLPRHIGDRYAQVVVTCLTCLDDGNEDFGDQEDMQDEDGILIGVRFIEKVLCRLGEICF